MRGRVCKRCKCKAPSRCPHSYSYVVDLPRGSNGRRRQKWVSGFDTQKAAEAALRKTLHVVDRHRDPFRGEEHLGARRYGQLRAAQNEPAKTAPPMRVLSVSSIANAEQDDDRSGQKEEPTHEAH